MKCGYCKTVEHKIGACNAGEHLLEVYPENYESLTARELKWLVARKKGKTSGKNKSDLLKMLKESECPICMESLVATEKTVCGHSFCKSCLNKHLEKDYKCPLCRTALKDNVEESTDIIDRVRGALQIYMSNPENMRDETVIRLLTEFRANPSSDLLVEIINRFGMIEIERLRNITITI